MRLLVWRLEWAIAFRRRRLFVLNVLIPLLLVVPVAVSPAPAFHAAAVYTVLFVLFGTFGSAIPLIRDGEEGLLERILVTGIPPGSFLLQRLAGGALLDAVQLAPSLVVVAVAGGSPAGTVLGVGALLVLSLFLAGLLGAWIGGLARSVAEGALFAAVAALLALHGSGVFRTPEPGSLGERVQEAAPFRPLHEGLLTLAGAPGGDPGGSGLPFLLLALLLGAGLTAVVAEALIRRAGGSG